LRKAHVCAERHDHSRACARKEKGGYHLPLGQTRRASLGRRTGEERQSFIAALSADGRLVAAIDTRGDVVHVWDAVTGAPVAEIRTDGLESPGLAFSPDGRWLAATGGSDAWRSANSTFFTSSMPTFRV
jgi:WD40 repeat protein